MVERDSYAAITDLRQNLDRLKRIVVRKPVGVVSQQHHTLVSTTLRLHAYHSLLCRIYPPTEHQCRNHEGCNRHTISRPCHSECRSRIEPDQRKNRQLHRRLHLLRRWINHRNNTPAHHTCHQQRQQKPIQLAAVSLILKLQSLI